MLRVSDLKINTADMGKALLTSISPKNLYQNGVRTDKVVGHRYMVAYPDCGLRKLAVVIDGEQLLPDDVVKGFPEVEFSGLEISVYQTSDKIGISATATGISLVGASREQKAKV